MEFLGKIGIFSPTNNSARKYTMILALLSTILGWSFLIFADFAISTKYEWIEMAQFNYGSIGVRTNLENFDNVEFTTLSLGLKAVAWTRINATFSRDDDFGTEVITERVVTTFDEFCSGPDGATGVFFVDPENCDSCQNASRKMVTSILMSTVTYFFTFTTDVLRIWPN